MVYTMSLPQFTWESEGQESTMKYAELPRAFFTN